MTKDKITDEYIKAVQKQFKHYHAADTRFISDLKDAVISYAAQQDSLDYEQLVSQFGDPQELVNDYFSEQSIDKQKRSLRFSRNVKITGFHILSNSEITSTTRTVSISCTKNGTLQ